MTGLEPHWRPCQPQSPGAPPLLGHNQRAKGASLACFTETTDPRKGFF